MKDSKVISHECPNCSAALVYKIETQNWYCDFCGQSFFKSEPVAETLQAEFVKAQEHIKQTLEDPVKNWSANTFSDDGEIQVYYCNKCGGRVLTDKNTVSTFCAFCHSPTIVNDRLKGDFKPDIIIPFKVTKEEALESFKKVVRGNILLPKRFKQSVLKGEITGLYAPFWMFSSEIGFDLQAEGVKNTVWTVGDHRHTKVDTYSINRQGEIPIKLLPVDASARLDNNIMDAIEPFHYNELENFDTIYLSGMFAESYDEHHNISHTRFNARANQGVLSFLKSSIPSYDSLSIQRYGITTKDLKVEYAMLPVWVLSIKSGNKNYTFAINGQTGKSGGSLPFSKIKTILFWLFLVATSTLLIAILKMLF